MQLKLTAKSKHDEILNEFPDKVYYLKILLDHKLIKTDSLIQTYIHTQTLRYAQTYKDFHSCIYNPVTIQKQTGCRLTHSLSPSLTHTLMLIKICTVTPNLNNSHA